MIQLPKAQSAAVAAARAVGALMRRNLHAPKKANATTAHDIKLELDVRSQALIERALRRAFPAVAFMGEEGPPADADAPSPPWRWVVDPIDGTVNFAYAIPHACVSIALQHKLSKSNLSTYQDGYQTVLGVVYEPFTNELFTAIRGKPARLNGKIIRVSPRARLADAIVSLGSPNSNSALETALPRLADLARRARKIRIMGSAALSLCYVACGRFDAYLENGLRLWDIAAGALLVESAGGHFSCQPIPGTNTFSLLAANKKLPSQLRNTPPLRSGPLA